MRVQNSSDSLGKRKKDMAQPPNICFYSNNCKWSEAFLQEVSKTPYKREFNYICVDPGKDGRRPQLPKFLQKVPTLVIKGEEEPRTDGNVMNWIYERRMKDTSAQQSGPAPRKGNDPAAVKEPEAWVQAEFGGMGPSNMASYSFIDSDTSVQGNGGDTIPGSFYFLNGGAAPASKNDAYGNGGGAEKRTKREQMFDNQMEEYMKYRDVGMPKAPPRV